MKTIYITHDGTKLECCQPDIPIKVPIMFRYYRLMDSFSLFIDPRPDQYKQMERNKKKNPDGYIYSFGYLVCPTNEFSNPEAWEIEGLSDMPEDMYERLIHYWKGYTEYWFKAACGENTREWRDPKTTLGKTYYLSDTIIPEANNCTFILGGECNGIRFSKLSNVLIHILDGSTHYEVE